MVDTDHERALLMLTQALDQWGHTVPNEAVRFHEKRASLLSRIADARSPWRIFERGAIIAALMRDTQAMSSLADGLASALQRVKQIKVSVEQTRVAVAKLNDIALAQWFGHLGARWHYGMEGIGRTTGREQDLSLDLQIIDGVEWEVKEVRASIRSLADAYVLLSQFGGHMKAAVLRADLVALRETLLREMPTVAWRDAVSRAMAPLQAVANEPAPEPPRDLSSAYRSAREAESWAAAVGVDIASAQDLLRRVDEAQRDATQWTDSAVEALVTETTELAARLRDEARRRRTAMEDALKADLHAVQQACGALQDLADEIRGFDRISGEEPYHHEEWAKTYPSVRQKMLHEIGARRRDVVVWFRARRSILLARIGDLTSRPLLAADVQARAVLAAEIESSESLPDAVEPILDRLHAMLRWIAATDGLEERARAAAEAIERRRIAVGLRHAEIAGYEASLGLPAEDISAVIEELRTVSGVVEPILDRLSVLEKQIDRRDIAIVQKCRERVAEDAEIGRKAAALVQTVLSGVTPPPTPVWTVDITAGVAVNVWQSAKRSREEALALVAQATFKLTAQLPEVRAQLEEALARPDIAEEQRNSAQEVIEVLTAERWKALGPLDGFDRLKRALGRADVQLQELSARENEIARLRSEIDKALALASEEGLRKYMPAAPDQRARALWRGLPQKPRYLGAAIEQLNTAHVLYARAFEHARRVGVKRFLASLAEVNTKVTRDAAFAARAEPVLREVRLLPPDQLPPADVRERIIRLAPPAPAVQRRGHHGG